MHRNSITNWLRDACVQKLVSEFQENIQHKREDMTMASVHRTQSPLLQKAVEKLEAMLESKSPQRQMDAIAFLLNGSVAPQEKQDTSHGAPSLIRLEPALRSLLRVKQSVV